jgi:hypothetical protein
MSNIYEAYIAQEKNKEEYLYQSFPRVPRERVKLVINSIKEGKGTVWIIENCHCGKPLEQQIRQILRR